MTSRNLHLAHQGPLSGAKLTLSLQASSFDPFAHLLEGYGVVARRVANLAELELELVRRRRAAAREVRRADQRANCRVCPRPGANREGGPINYSPAPAGQLNPKISNTPLSLPYVGKRLTARLLRRSPLSHSRVPSSSSRTRNSPLPRRLSERQTLGPDARDALEEFAAGQSSRLKVSRKYRIPGLPPAAHMRISAESERARRDSNSQPSDP
jgi:hypothetical protein